MTLWPSTPAISARCRAAGRIPSTVRTFCRVPVCCYIARGSAKTGSLSQGRNSSFLSSGRLGSFCSPSSTRPHSYEQCGKGTCVSGPPSVLSGAGHRWGLCLTPASRGADEDLIPPLSAWYLLSIKIKALRGFPMAPRAPGQQRAAVSGPLVLCTGLSLPYHSHLLISCGMQGDIWTGPEPCRSRTGNRLLLTSLWSLQDGI